MLFFLIFDSNGTAHVEETVEPAVPASKGTAPVTMDSEIATEKAVEIDQKEDQPQQAKDLSMEDKEQPESEDKQPEPDPEPQPSG